jgi:hypothetical protein
MAITREEIKFSYDEWEFKVEQVFLEEASQPSSEYGDGIPRGILMLTNRRLFFFDMDTGPIEESKKSRLLSTSFKLADQFVPFVPFEGIEKIIQGGEFLTELTEYCLSRQESGYLNFEPLLDNKGSFVVPVERIVSCEKFGRYWSPNMGFGPFQFKRKYTKIGISEGNYVGARTNYYCIYCVNPKKPTDPNYLVRFDKWFDELSGVTKNDVH